MRRGKELLLYIQELGFISFSSYLIQRFVWRRNILKIKLDGMNDRVCIRNQSSDHALFTQIFIHKEYGNPIPGNILRIIDCGANIGLAALYFLRQYPNAVITCLEPDEANYRILKMNTENYKNVTCFQKAIWHVERKVKVYGESRGSAGLMVKEADIYDDKGVEAVTLGSLMEANKRIDILKIDIEGSEKQVLLEGNTGWISNIQTMFIELHEDIHPGITTLVTRKFNDQFSIRQAGEYHVFERV